MLWITSVQQTFLHFWSSHHTTHSFYPLICSCHSPHALQIPLGSKFLTDLSTFKCLHFGMLYHTIFALILILLNLILFSHYLLLNSTSSWKLTFFFIPILLSLISLSLLDWPLGTLICACLSFIIHSISFILDPFICSTRFIYVCHIVCRNKLTGIHWIPVSFMMHSKSSSYHHIFHFTFSHFISSFVCHMHVVVWMRKKKLKKIKFVGRYLFLLNWNELNLFMILSYSNSLWWFLYIIISFTFIIKPTYIHASCGT